MNYFVSVIWSESLSKFYIGTTTDPERRIREHNEKTYKDSFTARGVPWKRFLVIKCESSQQAYALERFIKRMKSTQFVRKLADDQNLVKEILSHLPGGEIGIPKLRERRT